MAFTLGQDVITRELGIDRTTIYRNIQNLVGYYDYVIYLPGRKGLNSVWYIVKPDEDKDSIELRDKMPESLLNRYDTLCSGSQLYVAKTSQLAEMQCVIEKMQHNIEDSTEDYVAKTSQELDNKEVTEKMQHNIEGSTEDYVTKSIQSVESEDVTEKMPHNVSGANATLIYNNIINKKENINNKKEIVSKSNSKVPKEKSTQDSNGVGNLEGTDIMLTTTKDFNNFHMSESNTQETLEVKNLKEQITALQLENEQLKKGFEDKMREIRNWYDTKNKPYIDQLQNELNAVREENEELKANIAQLQSNQQAPLAATTTSNSEYKENLSKFYDAKKVKDAKTAKHYLDILNSLPNLDTRQSQQVQNANRYYQETFVDKQKTTTQSNSIIPYDLLDEAKWLFGEAKKRGNEKDYFNSQPLEESEQIFNRVLQVRKQLQVMHQDLKKDKNWQAALRDRELLDFVQSDEAYHSCSIDRLQYNINAKKLSKPLKTVAFVEHPGLD